MKVYVLKDMYEGSVDVVILTQDSTKQDIEDVIWRAKQIEGYQWCDIEECLPSDCTVLGRGIGFEEICY